MKTTFLVLTALSFTAFYTAGCGSAPTVIDETSNTNRVQSVDKITPKDWADAAALGAESLLKSNALVRYKEEENGGKKPLMMVNTIKNKTAQHINTQLLTERITETVLNSGQASITSAVAGDGSNDSASKSLLNLEDDEDFDQSTVTARGNLKAPTLSLFGEIIEQQVKEGREREASFFFSMKLTNTKTGELIWKYNKEISKRKTNDLFGY